MLKVGGVTLISMSEAVKRFGISDETLRRAIRQKQLQAIRASGRTFFKPEDVRRWKERYYYPSKADAVRVRWERRRKRQKAKGSEESGGNNAATAAQ
jgi:excisionase family DNA binding protein